MILFYNKGNIKGPYYWPFLREIHQWLVDSPQKGPAKWKAFPCHDDVITTNRPFIFVMNMVVIPQPTFEAIYTKLKYHTSCSHHNLHIVHFITYCISSAEVHEQYWAEYMTHIQRRPHAFHHYPKKIQTWWKVENQTMKVVCEHQILRWLMLIIQPKNPLAFTTILEVICFSDFQMINVSYSAQGLKLTLIPRSDFLLLLSKSWSESDRHRSYFLSLKTDIWSDWVAKLCS